MSENQPSNNTPQGRPGVCRTCGSIVAAGLKDCEQCGAPLAPPRANRSRGLFTIDRSALEFVRSVMGRSFNFTIVFMSANIFVFLLMWGSTGMNLSSLAFFDTPLLLSYGAKLNHLINQGHEWWRFVTPMFVHGGIIHLLFNMYGLWALGPWVEKFYGSSKFVVLYVASGVGGVVASYLSVRPSLAHGIPAKFIFKSIDLPSVGASGALFGLIGVLFVFGIKFRHELPEGLKRVFGTGMLPTILLNVFIGISIPIIDNAAHLGGLVTGAALALVISYKRPVEKIGLEVTWRTLQVAALILVAVSFVMLVRHFTPYQTYNARIPAFIEAVNAGDEALNAAVKGDASKLDRALKLIENAPPPTARSEQLLVELKSLLQHARDYAAMPKEQKESVVGRNKLVELLSARVAWNKHQHEWLEDEGRIYGLELTKSTPANNGENSTK